MRNSQRILALGVFAAFAIALGGTFATPDRIVRTPGVAAAILPAAHANPVDVSVQDTLKKGETLSQLLRRVRLAEDEAGALLAELTEYQDPRRMRPGSIISYRRSYIDGSVRGMEFRIDADRTVRMQRDGEVWSSAIEEVPVRSDTTVLTGTVLTSLYSALLHGEGDIPRAERESVADLLADRVFAWQVDFSRDIRKGDTYRILYERDVRPDGSARAGRILAVQFRVNGRDMEAFRLASEDGRDDYYQRDGESLRRAFLRAPLQYRRISSTFSTNRFHPILQRNRAHNGIDYAADAGTQVRAVGDGTVVSAGRVAGYGNLIEIRHVNGYTTRYAHLRGFAKGISRGVRVKQEDVIGYVGMTGLATGPHLHYEFRHNGQPVNPNSIAQITGDPVPASRRAEFASLVDRQILALNQGSPEVMLAARNSIRSRASE